MNHWEAERWVIGGLLIKPENIDRIRGTVSPEDFLDPSHSKIFSVIEDLHDREDIPLDLTTIYSCLREEEDSLKIARFLEQETPTCEGIRHWAKMVRKQSLERQLREFVNEDDIDSGKVEAIINELGNLKKEGPLYRSVSKIPPMVEAPGFRIETGFIDLDRNLKFGLGNLMVIAGKTGQGKTSLGLGILQYISEERSVGVVSIEMTSEEVRERLNNSFGVLRENLFVSDPSALSTLEFKNICKEMKADQGVDVILVDYLQLMREREDFRSRHLEVSHIIRRIKETSKELQIGIMAISQLSRGIDHRGEGSLPSLSDLKESGDIEYAADSILFIHQPQKEEKDDYRGENVKLLIIAKNRWGSTGKIKLYWDGKKTKFGTYQEGNE